MLAVTNLQKVIGGRTLIESADFRLQPGECVALVGLNGSGKSTLLRILAGRDSRDGGEINRPKDCTIGYLPQHADMEAGHSLREELRRVFAEVLSHEAQLETLAHRMAEVDPTSDEYERIAERFGHLHHEMERLNAWEMDANIGRIASGLGFRAEDLERPCREFSGGWRMRILLARLLLQNPDVLLLDEPTNHLDLETMIWLEEWIRAADSTVLMVSHERAFMDNLAARVFEIHEGQLTIYKGNYTAYLDQRRERWEQWARAYANQQEEIAKTQRFIDKFRYKATKAVQVQSRVKTLEKMERIPPPPSEPGTIHFRFPEPDRGSKEVFAAERVAMRFGETEVLCGVDFSIWRGERAALVGLNGAGKTTLLKLLAGFHRPTAGEVRRGPNTTIEYFAQYDEEGVSPSNTVFNEVASVAPSGAEQYVRNILGGFFFSGPDADKLIGVLSGGERTRVRLAKMLLSGANTLLLDEPTNHLDLASRRTLEDAMTRFPGTLLFVSHDRVFLERVPTRILEIRDGRVRSFEGNYRDYTRALAALGEESPLVSRGGTSGGRAGKTPQRAGGAGNGRAPGASGETKPPPDGRNRGGAERQEPREPQPDGGKPLSGEARKAAQREQRRLSREVGRLESEISRAELRLGELERELQKPEVYNAPDRLAELGREQKELQRRLADLTERWTDHQSALEGLKVD